MTTATRFVDAAALGLGWCMAPEALLQSALDTGRTVLIAPDRWVDVPLYWQHAAVRSDTLQTIGAEPRRAANQALRARLHG